MATFRFCPQCARELVERETAGAVRRVCPDESCGFVFYDNPLPVVAALLEHEGNVLLVRNKGWPAGWFGLVTGFLERGETPEQGVVREVKEETGLDAEVVGLIGVYDYVQRNEVIVAYHLRGRGVVAIGDEIEAVKPVAVDKLKPWPFGTGHAVRDWLAKRVR